MKKLSKDEELPNQSILINGKKITIKEYRENPNKYNSLQIPKAYLDRVECKVNNKVQTNK